VGEQLLDKAKADRVACLRIALDRLWPVREGERQDALQLPCFPVSLTGLPANWSICLDTNAIGDHVHRSEGWIWLMVAIAFAVWLAATLSVIWWRLHAS
jgi:hypothetical protein